MKQMSESFLTIACLSMSGGLQDAYTFFARGKVFANAQTGNLILLASHIYKGSTSEWLRYALPVFFFALGVVIAEVLRRWLQMKSSRIHWRQWVVALEIVLLTIVAFIPASQHLIANTMVSLSCAIQLQTFKKVHGYGFASTMCIGNLRSGTEALMDYLYTKNRKKLKQMASYFGVLICFSIGAVLGDYLIQWFGNTAILGSCLLLLIAMILMIQKPR